MFDFLIIPKRFYLQYLSSVFELAHHIIYERIHLNLQITQQQFVVFNNHKN